jgi:hypothetical protein
MKEIIVSSQVDFDALPNSFDEYTRILIKNTTSKLVVKISRENSSVVAWENSSVEARGNSSVVARENSSVVARENSSVVAWGNSSVVAWENCVVRIFSDYLKKIVLYGFAVAIVSSTITVNIEKKSEYCHVQIIKSLGWFENNGVEKTPTVTLYKKVSKDFKTQENTKNETLWIIGSTLEHPAWNPNNGECGEGKFHACSAMSSETTKETDISQSQSTRKTCTSGRVMYLIHIRSRFAKELSCTSVIGLVRS